MGNWTREQYEDYKRRSDSAKAVATRPQASVAQSPVRHEPLATPKASGRDKKRVVVSVSQFTRRPQDTDNCCPKYEVDWLRSQGFISDDSYFDIALEIRQILVQTKEDEGVLIEIY